MLFCILITLACTAGLVIILPWVFFSAECDFPLPHFDAHKTEVIRKEMLFYLAVPLLTDGTPPKFFQKTSYYSNKLNLHRTFRCE